MAVLTFLFSMNFVRVEQGCLWSEGFWCLSTHPPQPFLPILLRLLLLGSCCNKRRLLVCN